MCYDAILYHKPLSINCLCILETRLSLRAAAIFTMDVFHVEHRPSLPCPLGLLGPEKNHEQRDIRWIDPADSAGLSQSLGLNGLEFLAGFDAQAVGF